MDNDKSINWRIKFTRYLKQNFSKKNNIHRLIGFVLALIIVLAPSLTCNLMIRFGHWHGPVVYNDGIAFSSLSGKTALIYFLQSFTCLVVFLAITFTNKWYYSTLLSMAFIGGLFNLVDRATQISAHANSVIDYLHTGNTLSNFPDVFILTGIIGFGVVYIIFMTIYTYSKNKKTKNEKDKS